MRLGMLLEKIRTALREDACAFCAAQVSPEESLCDACAGRLGVRESYPLFSTGHFSLYAATLFNAQIKKIIYSHKFYGKPRAELMSRILAHYWRELSPGAVPESVWVAGIPPHEGKPDHLSGIVRGFASHFGYRYVPGALAWQRPVEPQHHLSGKRRRFENVADGMRARLEPAPGKTPRQIIVIDDITTTGATMLEAGRALRSEIIGDAPVTGLALCSVSLAFQKHLL